MGQTAQKQDNDDQQQSMSDRMEGGIIADLLFGGLGSAIGSAFSNAAATAYDCADTASEIYSDRQKPIANNDNAASLNRGTNGAFTVGVGSSLGGIFTNHMQGGADNQNAAPTVPYWKRADLERNSFAPRP